MDERFEYQGVTFVWDKTKAQHNKAKHGITFHDAVEVFFDPFVRVTDASVNNEPRDAVIGMDTCWNLLFVVHIIFEDDVIRLISARRATRSERLMYEN